LPELIAFCADHVEHRDKFEVFAIHDSQVKSLAELDKKLVSIKKQHWQGKDLPFPILLDGNAATHKLYGVRGWPTAVLIDPEGKVVGETGLGALEEKLPALPAAKRWARHRDMQKNVFWSFEPAENTLAQFAETLQRWSGCLIEIDPNAVQAAGLATNGPLPGVLIGSSITLRSIEELLLAPHGLGLAPAVDGKTLSLTKRPESKELPSYFQKLHANELIERLDRGLATTEKKGVKALEIKDQPLLEAIKLIGREYDLPVALEAKAMRLGKIDPKSKVSGTIDPRQLHQSLVSMLKPLGLTIEIRQEVVVVTPTTQ
jgi:hypothetical protein